MDSAIKGNFNGDHMKQQEKRWHWKNQQSKDEDRVFIMHMRQKFQTSEGKRISKEYSFKTRSFRGKD